MPTLGFEPTISAGERPKTYALKRAATGTDYINIISTVYCMEVYLRNQILCTKTHTRQTLSPLHVSTRLTCNHQEVLSVAKAAPSKCPDAQKGAYSPSHTCTRVKTSVQTLEYRQHKC
jgi:hypothetical protein